MKKSEVQIIVDYIERRLSSLNKFAIRKGTIGSIDSDTGIAYISFYKGSGVNAKFDINTNFQVGDVVTVLTAGGSPESPDNSYIIGQYTGVSNPIATTNLMVNGDMERGLEYWSFADASAVVDTTYSYMGNQCLKVTPEVIEVEGSVYQVTASTVCHPNELYKAEAYVMTPQEAYVKIRTQWFDSNGNDVAFEVSESSEVYIAEGLPYIPLNIVEVSPDSASQCRIDVIFRVPDLTNEIYIDNVGLYGYGAAPAATLIGTSGGSGIDIDYDDMVINVDLYEYCGLQFIEDKLSAKTDDTTVGINVNGELYSMVSGGIPDSLIDAKGDLIVGTADNTPGKLTAGGDGKRLVTLSSESTGLLWEDDALYNLDDVDVDTPVDGEILTYNGATSEWLNRSLSQAGVIPATALEEQGDIIYASATGVPAALHHGNSNDVFISGGHGASPSYIAPRSTMRTPVAILHSDGTASLLDAITTTAFTMTGGVSNAWTESANFRSLLGVSAPVIAQATTNLLTYASDNSTFEGNTAGGWGDTFNCTIAANATQGWHGTHSLKMTVTAGGSSSQCRLGVFSLVAASTAYAVSVKFKGMVGESYRIRFGDDVSGYTYSSTVVADGTWQTISMTKTLGAGITAANLFLHTLSDANTGDVVYWDAIQLETGAIVTPYCVDSADDPVTRTACSCRIATPFVAGQAISIMCVVNTAWAGNDSNLYLLFNNGTTLNAANEMSVYKLSDNKLLVTTRDAANAYKQKKIACTVGNWAAGVPHVIIATLSADNTQGIYLDGVAGTITDGTGGREAANGATCYIGTSKVPSLYLNGSILCAVWGRVLSAAEITALSTATTWASVPAMVDAAGEVYFDAINDRLMVATTGGWKAAILT